jgi:hypothetical protein
MQGSSPASSSGTARLPANPVFQTVTAQGVSTSGDVFANGVDITGIDHQSLPIALRGRITTSGAPTTGTWSLNDAVFDSAGVLHLCTAAGTPGIWDFAAVTPPVVSQVSSSTVTSSSAILAGVVNPGGTATTYQFLYGTTTAYGQVSPILPTFADDDTNDQPVTATITGLTLGTTYHFQLIAINSGGSVASADFTFQTTGGTVTAPTVTIVGSSLITQTTAKLEALMVPNGAATTATLEYGTTSAYGTSASSAPGAVGSGFATYDAATNVGGLTANTLYHWRWSATNSAGTTHAADQTFTTTNVAAPTAVTQAATGVGNSGATLNGQSNPNSSAATYHFEIGTATGVYSMPHIPASDASVGSDNTVHSLSQVTGLLASGVQYFFRVVTTGPGGTTFGSELNFTTTSTLIPAQFHRINYSPSGPLAQPRQPFSRYQVVILQRSGVVATDQSRIAAIKAENPSCKVLVYQDAYYYRTGSGGNLNDAIDPTIQNAHEAWFLHDSASGVRLQSPYAGWYLMNLGQPDMQSFVVSGVTAAVNNSGFDGVFFDDLTSNVAWSYPTKTYGQAFNATTNPRLSDSRFPVTPSTGAITPAGATAWQAEVTYFVQNAITTLRNSGMPVYANLGGTWAFASANLWQTWSQYLDGSMEESLGDVGSGLKSSTFYVPQQLANLAWSEANGHKTFVTTLNTTELGQAYGLAMMLLVSNGHIYKGTQNNGAYISESWYGASGISGANEYDKALLLGSAAGAYTGTATTGYMRTFTGGSVANVKLNTTAGALTIGGTSVPAYTGQINYTP